MNMPAHHRRWVVERIVAPFLGVLLFLPACSGPDPGLQEQLARVQSELQQANARLQERTAELERINGNIGASTSTPRSSAEAAAGVGEVQTKGEAAARGLAAQFAAAQPELTAVDIYLGPVRTSSAPLIFISELVVSLRRSDGTSLRQTQLVAADAAGNWIMPTVPELAALAQATRTDSTVRQRPSNPPSSAGPEQRPNSTGMKDPSKSGVFEWGPTSPSSSSQDPAAAAGRREPVPPTKAPVGPGAGAGPPGAAKSGSFSWSGDAPAAPTGTPAGGVRPRE